QPVFCRGRLYPERSLRGEELGSDVACAMNAIAFALEKTHHARQHVIIAADAKAEQEGQILDGAEIESDFGKVRPRHRADDDKIAAPLVCESGEELADLTPFQPSVRIMLDRLVGFAAYAENMHGPALGQSRFGKRCGKRASPSDNAKRTFAGDC